MDFETDFETDFENQIQNGNRTSNRVGTTSHLPSAVTFEMRCPNCQKLYSVSPQIFSHDEDDVLKFECVACETVFLTIKPELHGSRGLQTRRLETQLAPLADWDEIRQSSARSTEAPKTETLRLPETSITPTFSDEPARVAAAAAPLRPHPIEDFELAQSAEILALWDSIVDKYEDLSRHEIFLRRCFEERKLAFATRKYAQILVLDPEDRIARRMRREAQGLASYGFDGAASVMSPSTWAAPLSSFNNLIIFLGAIALVVGLGLPHMREVAAVGTAMIALAVGLRFTLRRPN